jgi:hypothetical protein
VTTKAFFRLAVVVFALSIEASTIAVAQKRTVTCSGILIEVDMIAGAAFPMAVVYDNTDELNTRTCVLDVGRAGHWPLKGACWTGREMHPKRSLFQKNRQYVLHARVGQS